MSFFEKANYFAVDNDTVYVVETSSGFLSNFVGSYFPAKKAYFSCLNILHEKSNVSKLYQRLA